MTWCNECSEEFSKFEYGLGCNNCNTRQTDDEIKNQYCNDCYAIEEGNHKGFFCPYCGAPMPGQD